MHFRPAIVLTATSLIVMGACAAIAMADEPGANPQTICPVMGRPIDKQFYADHDGKRIYFCCATCVKTFKNNPERYIEKLNAEGVSLADAPAAEAEEGEHHQHEGIGEFVEPLGITTFTFLGLTAIAGALMRRKPKVLRKAHIYLAVATIVLALIHISLVMLGD